MALFMRKYYKWLKKEGYNCGSTEHFIALCPSEIKDNKYKDKKESKADHKKSKRHMGEAHIGHEWDSTKDSSSRRMRRWQPWPFTSHPPHQALQQHVR